MEVRFLKQTVCQNALFVYQEISFYCFYPLFESNWGVFFTSTFTWELWHAVDGFIIVLFHFRLSQIGINSTP
ncbi:hypothetical protein KIN20_016724 [Parelaphostrongylus tenuis]|uniref:7TM GPCR serpentine receptor class x (Srx) domain-containing protein n=1 Tax=Parelaphostrongylus tenuis TaxID=148309 RepID=A0AAD5N1P5_PARTN|nr:hypothetical protein KIN20_016724 [Parelaphostrongylus tenuis]